jgi:hypothetical protein
LHAAQVGTVPQQFKRNSICNDHMHVTRLQATPAQPWL